MVKFRFTEFPTADEAMLSLLRQQLVTNFALKPIAELLGLSRYMRAGPNVIYYINSI